MSRSHRTSGLDQIGPVRYVSPWDLEHRSHSHKLNTRAKMSSVQRNVPVTLATYERGLCRANYPMPTIKYTEELVHWRDDIHFCLMYPNWKSRRWEIVGDYPDYPLFF